MVMINYVCKTCNYKFKRKKDSSAIACPYCGSKKVDEYKPTTAEDLLNSVE